MASTTSLSVFATAATVAARPSAAVSLTDAITTFAVPRSSTVPLTVGVTTGTKAKFGDVAVETVAIRAATVTRSPRRR